MTQAVFLSARTMAPLIVIGLTAYLFARALQRNWHNLEGVSLTPNFYSALAIILFILAVIGSGILWGVLVGRLSGKVVSTRDAIRIHCASWLLKYVPGQAGSILNKLVWGKKNGFTKKSVTNSFIYENVLMVLAGATLSIPVVFIFKDQIGGNLSLLLPLLAIIPMFFIICRPIFYRVINFAFIKLKREPFAKENFLSGSDIVRYFVGYLFPRLLNGIGFVFIALSITAIESGMYIGLAATYILAGIVGMLAIFVPSGLGVREALIVLLAGQYIGTEQAIVLALVSRFYATIADIGVFAVYLVLNKGRLRQL